MAINLRVKPAAARALRKGHPFLFDEAITRQTGSDNPRAGDVCVVYDDERALVAVGLYDPRSPLRVRVLSHRKPVVVDDALFAARVTDAIAKRAHLPTHDARGETTGYRLVHGENDGLPAVVVDRYGDTALMKLYSAVWFPRLAQLTAPLMAQPDIARVVVRLSRSLLRDVDRPAAITDGAVVAGTPLPPMPLHFLERGLRYEVDVVSGQKTGFFLDQRDNRARVEDSAKGARVLNVFSYSGGFSLAAARGGAVAVTSVDLSPHALDAARRTFADNAHDARIAACVHDVICGDAFDVLKDLVARGARYEVVVIDPPSFAKSKDEVPGALASYERLAVLGVQVTAPGGLLVLASCSSRVSAVDFRAACVDAAYGADTDLEVQDETHHADDHPATFPEAYYLKALWCRPRPREST